MYTVYTVNIITKDAIINLRETFDNEQDAIKTAFKWKREHLDIDEVESVNITRHVDYTGKTLDKIFDNPYTALSKLTIKI